MTTRRLALALALLPCLTLAPACDEAGGKGSVSDGVADSDGGGDTDDGAATDGPAGSTSDDATTDAATTTDGTDGTDGSSGSTTQEPPPPPPPPPVKPDPTVPCPGADWDGDVCTTEGGLAGTSFCIVVDGVETQTPCYPDAEIPCYPGDYVDQGCLGWICAWDGENLYNYDWSEPDCNTPLVVDFDGGPLRFEPVGAASFDIGGVGECLATDWPALPWLALDRDGDGTITDGRELFGSGTVLASGLRATGGFEALAELDANHDGKLTPADPAFAELVLWTDRDGDRRGELAELLPVREASLVAIDLAYTSSVECDDRGNCGRERARFEFRAPTGEVRTGELVDVYLACQLRHRSPSGSGPPASAARARHRTPQSLTARTYRSPHNPRRRTARPPPRRPSARTRRAARPRRVD